jgi:DNA-binding NarL/FixJ family response regulator
MRFILLLLACTILAVGQDRDFLTADEADQVREAQEPNLRLSLYVKFAQARIELLKQLLAKEKPGRSALIHSTLEDYTRIIEAMDTVADDALKRKVDITEGMKLVSVAQKEMLEALEKLDENPAKDYGRYEFAMQQAIETTKDSFELSQEDLKERTAEVLERDRREKAEREALMPVDELKQKKAAQQKADETKRKVPTLRRKGEEVPKRP